MNDENKAQELLDAEVFQRPVKRTTIFKMGKKLPVYDDSDIMDKYLQLRRQTGVLAPRNVNKQQDSSTLNTLNFTDSPDPFEVEEKRKAEEKKIWRAEQQALRRRPLDNSTLSSFHDSSSDSTAVRKGASKENISEQKSTQKTDTASKPTVRNSKKLSQSVRQSIPSADYSCVLQKHTDGDADEEESVHTSIRGSVEAAIAAKAKENKFFYDGEADISAISTRSSTAAKGKKNNGIQTSTPLGGDNVPPKPNIDVNISGSFLQPGAVPKKGGRKKNVAKTVGSLKEVAESPVQLDECKQLDLNTESPLTENFALNKTESRKSTVSKSGYSTDIGGRSDFELSKGRDLAASKSAKFSTSENTVGNLESAGVLDENTKRNTDLEKSLVSSQSECEHESKKASDASSLTDILDGTTMTSVFASQGTDESVTDISVAEAAAPVEELSEEENDTVESVQPIAKPAARVPKNKKATSVKKDATAAPLAPRRTKRQPKPKAVCTFCPPDHID